MLLRLFLMFVYCLAALANEATAADDSLEDRKAWLLLHVQSATYAKHGVRSGERRGYQTLVADATFKLPQSSLVFPETLYSNADYVQALHASYLVWALSLSGRNVDVPLQNWLEVVIDTDKAAPPNQDFQQARLEITQLLLETQLRREPDVFARLPYYLNYLHRLQASSPEMFEAVIASLLIHSEVLKDTPALGALLINAGQDAPYAPVSALSIPRPAFIRQLSSRWPNVSNSSQIEDEYLAWVRNDLTAQDLTDFVLPFPHTTQSEFDYLRAWHWAYLLGALAKHGVAYEAPLPTWIGRMLPKATDSTEQREAAKHYAPVATHLIKTWLSSQKSQSVAMTQLLCALNAQGALPLQISPWKSLLYPASPVNDPQALFVLFDWAEQIAGEDLSQLSALVAELSNNLGYKKWDLHKVWPPSAYQKLVALSRDELPGSFSNGTLSIREYAWMMRIRDYGDQMSREQALSMQHWRTAELTDIYEERYQLVWGAFWTALLCFLFARIGRRKLLITSTICLAVLIPAGIYLSAMIAGIGHNNPNHQGYLSVIQFCLPYYAGLIGLFWLIGLGSMLQRLQGKRHKYTELSPP